jgi:hypothetical protein
MATSSFWEPGNEKKKLELPGLRMPRSHGLQYCAHLSIRKVYENTTYITTSNAACRRLCLPRERHPKDEFQAESL